MVLSFDAKSFAGRRLVHHSVDAGILTAGYCLEEFEHPENRFSAGQVGLSLCTRISGIGTEDMIYIPFAYCGWVASLCRSRYPLATGPSLTA